MLIIHSRATLMALMVTILFSCKKTSDNPPGPVTPVIPVNTKSITKFEFRQNDNHFIFGTDSTATIGTDTIKIDMPGGTDITKLIPTITITGSTVKPASGTVQDFTNPVTYTVTDSAGASKNYIVEVDLTGANEIIIAAYSLYAYDLTTGKLRWSTPEYKNIYYSATASDGKLVFSNATTGDIYAQDLITGKLVWTKNYSFGPNRTFGVSKGVIYLPASGQNMLALDAVTGNQLWSKYFDLNNLFQAMNIDNNILYFISGDNRVYSVNALSGNLNWQSDPTLVFNASPAVSGNLVYASGYDSNMYALDKNTGHVTWSTHIAFINSAPVIANAVVYIVGCNDSLYALDAVTGKKKWVSTGSSTVFLGNGITSSAMVANGMVYVNGNDGYLYAFDAGIGTLRWSTLLNQNGLELVYIDGVIYTSSYAINALTGNVIWSGLYTNPQNPRFTIIAKDGTVYNPVN